MRFGVLNDPECSALNCKQVGAMGVGIFVAIEYGN